MLKESFAMPTPEGKENKNGVIKNTGFELNRRRAHVREKWENQVHVELNEQRRKVSV